jgi:hypothetical protein
MRTTLLLAPPIFRNSYGPEYIIATLFMPTPINYGDTNHIHDHVVPEKVNNLILKNNCVRAGGTQGWLGVQRWQLCLQDTSHSVKCHWRAAVGHWVSLCV